MTVDMATADPGDTLMYTVTITNNGGTTATGVTFTDTIDGNTTLNAGSVQSTPIAVNDSYTASGNIQISLAAPGVMTNDVDPDTGNNTGLTVTQVQGSGANIGVSTATTAAGIGGVTGFVTLNANGSFGYEPPPGYTGGDTFTYQVTDAGGGTNSATVTITISQMVWFINNDAMGSLNRGTFSNPFTSIASFNTINGGMAPNAQPGHFIALRRGTGTYTEADGVNLQDTQKLIGEAVQFNTVFTADSNSSAAYNTFASGTMAAPSIVTTAGNGVDLGSGNTARGFNVSNTPGFFGFNGSTVGSPVINTVGKTGTGGAINIVGSGAFGSNVTFSTLESSSSPGSNINLVSVTGTLGVTSGGTGLSGSAAASAAININSGTVSMSYPGNITKSNTGSLLSVSNGHTTGTLTFTGTLNASAGDGLQFDNADSTTSYNFNGTTTLNGGDAGIDILNGSGGTFTFGSNTSITSPTGTAFNVAGGSPTVTYSGSITQNTASQRVVNIQGTSANTITFNTGTITGGASSTGIHIGDTTAVNGNVSFANMTLGTSGSRMTNQAVTIANGTGTYSLGAVRIFTNNVSGIVATNADGAINSTSGTVDSSNATAINIDGPPGLTTLGINLASVSSSSSPATGISIQDTDGSFSVVGDGGSTNNSSGGTIQNTTSHGISLTNTRNVSLDQMNIQSTGGSGINGTGVTNFTFTSGTINNSGNALGESNISFNGNGTLLGNNINGTLTVTSSTFTNAFDHGIHVQNDAGTISDAIIQNNMITSTMSTATSKGSGIQMVGTGNASTVSNLDKATISGNMIMNFPSNAGIQVIYGNVSAGGTGGHAGLAGNATNIVSITNNTVQGSPFGNHAIAISANGGNSGSRSQGNFDVSNNPSLTGTQGTTILIGNNGYATMTGTVNNNVIVSNNTVASQGIGGGNGIVASNAETPDLTLTVMGNNISQTDGNGILLVGRGVTGIAKLSIKNNTVAAPLTGVRPGIRVDAGNASSVDDAVCLDISGNTSGGSGGHPGIGVRKQGTNATVNDFGVEGLSPSPATCGQVEDFIAGLNPGSALGTLASCDVATSKRVLAISGSNFVSCSTAPVPPPAIIAPDDALNGSIVAVEKTGDGQEWEDSHQQTVDNQQLAVDTQQLQVAIFSPVEGGQTVAPGVSPGLAAQDNRQAGQTGDRTVVGGRKLEARAATVPVSFQGRSPQQQRTSDSGLRTPDEKKPTKVVVGQTKDGTPVYIVTSPQSGETISVGPFNLPAGESVQITFSVMIENPLLITPATQICNQGTVSGTNFSNVLTDDPNVGGLDDPTCTQLNLPDVTVSKSGPMMVVCDGTVTYTLTANNGGTADAEGVVVTDSLPACLTNVMVTGCPMGAACMVMGNTVTVNLGTLTAGSMATITIEATVPLGCAPSLMNQASISTSSLESDDSNNTSTVVTTTVTCPDVIVSKSGPATIICGDTITYTLSAENIGDAAAGSVMVSDTLPTCLTNVMVTGCPMGATCMVMGNTVTADLGTLAALGSATITITATVPAGCQPSIMNQAGITTSSTESNTMNNMSSVVTTAVTCPDITIGKDGPSSIGCTNTITYTLNVNNNGNADAGSVVVTDDLPDCLTGVMVTGCPMGAMCSVMANTVTVDLGTLGAMSGASITITATVDPSCVPGFSNMASVATSSTESNPSNNTSNTVTTTVGCSDVGITKSGPTTVICGDMITYTLTVTNSGSSDAEMVTVTDNLPDCLTNVMCMSSQGMCSVGAGNLVTANLGTVAAGDGMATVTITATVDPSCAPGLSNTASVTTTTPESTLGNNTSSPATTTVECPDVSITKSGSGIETCGDTITYMLTAENLGDAPAGSVMVTDTLPACLTNVMVTGCPMGATCMVMGNTVTLDLGTLAAGGMATIGITATVDPSCAPMFANQATISTTSPEQNAANNTSTPANTSVVCPDVSISKLGSSSVLCGESVTYTLMAQNSGDADAKDVMVTDDLPDCLTDVMVTGCPMGATCMVGPGNVVTVDLGTLAAMGGATITITATVPPDCGSSIDNTATITTSSVDSNHANNTSATVTTLVECSNVTISKIGPMSVVCNDQITYTLTVSNSGTAAAGGVMVIDDLPDCLTGVSCMTSQGTCNVGAGNVVTADLGTLTPMGSVTITITGTVDPGCPPGISNQASVSTTSPESDPDNSSGVVMTAVLCADLMVTKSASPDPVGLGQNLTYRATVHNNGPGAATSVTLTDPVPANTTFVSADSPAGWNCMAPLQGGTGTITCTKPSMADGETAVFTIVVEVDPAACGSTISNTATVSGATPEQNTMNNTAIKLAVTSNSPPMSDAGPDQSKIQGQPVTLSGAITDPDPNQMLTFSWSQTSGTMVTLNMANTLMPTFTAPPVPQGECQLLTFKLTVMDTCGDVATDTVLVSVEGAGANGLVMQDEVSGHCLRVFPCGGVYIWKQPDNTLVTGPVKNEMDGSTLIFLSTDADANLLSGAFIHNLNRDVGQADLRVPRNRGQQQQLFFRIRDNNLNDTPPCP